MGIVLFRPGAELMHLFMRGRVLLEPEPEEMASFSTGLFRQPFSRWLMIR
jgi:hypothetical protein